jgi:hypothetical protein
MVKMKMRKDEAKKKYILKQDEMEKKIKERMSLLYVVLFPTQV